MGFFSFFRNIGDKVKSGLGKVFGSQGILAPAVSTFSHMITGGKDDLIEAGKNALTGGISKGFDYLSKTAIPQATDYLSKQASSVPVIGGALSDVVNTIGSKASDMVDAANLEKKVEDVKDIIAPTDNLKMTE